jgi:hypothetical protein
MLLQERASEERAARFVYTLIVRMAEMTDYPGHE